MASPFGDIPPARWVASNALAFAIPDAFPVSPGHTLVVTRREVRDWFEATPEERLALLDHVIPRYEGDMDDPRGGVRHAIPWEGNYARTAAPPLAVGGADDPFLAH